MLTGLLTCQQMSASIGDAMVLALMAASDVRSCNSVSAQTRTLLCLVCLLLMAGGCSKTPVKPQTTQAPGYNQGEDSHWIITELYRQYQEWQGIPYRYGGTNRQGVDCSGMVQLTFRDRFQKSLPRTTLLQSQLGHFVTKDQLQAGDLVFFKTGEKIRHVGIYIEDGKFLHVSTKKGVMVSRLTDYYWRDRYQYARRVW